MPAVSRRTLAEWIQTSLNLFPAVYLTSLKNYSHIILELAKRSSTHILTSLVHLFYPILLIYILKLFRNPRN